MYIMVNTMNMKAWSVITNMWNIAHILPGIGIMYHGKIAIKRNTNLRILRDNIVIHSGDLDNLKRHSDEAKEVKEGLECGISIQNFNDIQAEDIIECYEIEKTPRKLVD